MDAFDDAIQRLQRDLDNLRGLLPPNGVAPQPKNGLDGDGDEEEDGPPPPPAPPPPRNPNLKIAGIEVTQGIQYFNFLVQGSADWGPVNSIPLVPNKETVIRVYVNRQKVSTSFSAPSTITGQCWATIPPAQQIEPTVDSLYLTRINGPISLVHWLTNITRPINRGNADDTLNFRLPAWRCTGTMGFCLIVWDSTKGRYDADWASSASETFCTPGFSFKIPDLPFTEIRPRVHTVGLAYTGPNPALPGEPPTSPPMSAPTPLAAQNTLWNSFVTKALPISQINITGSTSDSFGGDLRLDGSSGCGAGWELLITQLKNLRSMSSSGDVWVGVLPIGVPLDTSPTGAIGCGGGGVAAARVGDAFTMAHEIGHAYGRKHAPTQPTTIPPSTTPICTSPSNVDPDYPVYTEQLFTAAGSEAGFRTLPSGSIGELGFDTTTSEIHNPNDTFDFMGYCPNANKWVSPHTWKNLYKVFTTIHVIATGVGTAVGPASDSAAFASEAPPLAGEYLILNFRMHRDGEVDLSSSFHLVGVSPVPPSAEEAPVVVELRAADGGVVGVHRCHLTNHNFDPGGPYLDFHEVLPWVPETTSIAFLRDGAELQTLEVEERAPQITSRPVAEREGDRVRLAWEAQHDESSITYLVRYSNDGGNTWLAVAAGLTEPVFVADLADLPGGERCVFQVAASSTIRTTVAQTSAMAVPVKPRRPYILSPEPNSRFFQGEPVVLGGVGFSPDFETAPFDEVVWTSNVEGFLGYGYEVVTQTLTPGLHKITLGVADGLGEEASASLLIKIQPSVQPMVQPMD